MALKIIFMGTPEFSVRILKSIHNSNHKILRVYTQPPKKKNRGQREKKTPVHDYAIKKNIEVRYPENLNDPKELQILQNEDPDVVVVAAYGKIIPKKLIQSLNFNFINVHASLLPKWRGAAPIQRAIMNLDEETGISIMKIIPKLDSGPVMMKSKIKISKEMNFKDLNYKLSDLGAELIIKCLNLIEKNNANFIDQNEEEATYANKIEKVESKINWNEKAEKVIAKINALYPSPGSWFFYNGARLKITKAVEVKLKGNPGEVINKNFTIGCSENSIQVLELQKEGKKEMKTSEYLKGNKLKIGSNVN